MTPRGPLEVLHDAGGVLAVAKPAGLPTQAPPGIDSVESLVRMRLFGQQFAEAIVAAEAGGRVRHPGGFLGVPHRLDRPVSGVVLLATTPRAARQLSRQFERRQVVKTYRALVAARHPHGLAVGDSFIWEDLVRKIPDEPRVEVVAEGKAADASNAEVTAGAARAVTRGRVLESTGDRLWLELVPETGRMHQLRVQAATRGLPVVGDLLYGGPPLETAATDDAADPRSRPIALHAWRIAFADPETGAPVEVTCESGWRARGIQAPDGSPGVRW
jgi:23S rRNA pseudouridine1911/1915/1917 synthase